MRKQVKVTEFCRSPSNGKVRYKPSVAMIVPSYALWQKAISVASSSGMELPSVPRSEGEWHRVPGIGKGSRNRAGAYKVMSECVHLVDHASGWSNTVFPDSSESDIDSDELKRRHLEAKRIRRQQLEQEQVKQRIQLEQYLANHTSPAVRSPYTVCKQISLPFALPYSCRDQCLIVLLHNVDGLVQSAQRLYDNGMKRAWPGLPIKGAFHLIGERKTTTPLLICEGFATGATLHTETTYPVACAMFAANLLPVAKALRAAFPDQDIIVAGDDDRFTDGNPGRTKATEAAAAIGARVTFPVFPEGVAGTDFNDLHVATREVD